ncbi:MAG: hypothetical protein MJA83_05855 [Gammaproteobacteria bacterium]|nr:hypothetical protein [Gammaproteobacteria bacterium]
MPIDKDGKRVPMREGHILQVDDIWFRVHRISRKDVVLRRLLPHHARKAQAMVGTPGPQGELRVGDDECFKIKTTVGDSK